MKTIRIGGVPEHYNLPFYLLAEAQPFLDQGLRIDWQTYTTGTGHMLGDLHREKLDMAIVLTEGALTDQAAGNPVQILGHYVKSPLIWGVHAHVNHAQEVFPVSDQSVFGISRYTSGSHLMAYLYAQSKGVSLSEDQFNVVNNLPGAIAALEVGMADLFLWEKFTTKPTVDAGIFALMDEFPTPWEPFVMVTNERLASELEDVWASIIDWIFVKASLLSQPTHHEQTLHEVTQRFGLRYDDASEWLHQLEWDVRPVSDPACFDHVVDHLVKAGIIQANTVAV